MFDIIVRNGTIIEGTGKPRYRSDLGIVGDRIETIGILNDVDGRTEIDAGGKIVAPGFVDVHNHSDGWLLKKKHFLPKTSQGFTTEVIMADGISYAPVNDSTVREWLFYLRSLDALRMDEYRGWKSVADFMSCIDGHNVQNAIAHVPYANVRSLFCGFTKQFADDLQMRQIKAEIRQGMEAGAVGLSTGLDYIVQCYSTTDELVEACSAMAAFGGLYVTHVRYKLGMLRAMQEAVEIGRRAGVPVHISHIKGRSAEEVETILEYVDTVARKEVDLSFDVYPYQPGSTMLTYLLPYETWDDGPLSAIGRLNEPVVRARFRASLDAFPLPLDRIRIAWLPGKENACHQGKLLSQFIEESGRSTADALLNLLIEERLAVLLVFEEGDDRQIHPFLQHDLYMLGSDGIYFPDGPVHPRVTGSATRLLGPCVRDHRLFSLEDAVHKLSGKPAKRYGLKNRGVLREGYFADVVVFDPETVADRATYENPHQLSIGIEAVLVNGALILQEGVPVDSLTDPLPGRSLKFHRRN